ncbi:hypothetical protein [Gloeobacter violaceus]|nr:hypothetical protein [Gloeobacter violaceus]
MQCPRSDVVDYLCEYEIGTLQDIAAGIRLSELATARVLHALVMDGVVRRGREAAGRGGKKLYAIVRHDNAAGILERLAVSGEYSFSQICDARSFDRADGLGPDIDRCLAVLNRLVADGRIVVIEKPLKVYALRQPALVG